MSNMEREFGWDDTIEKDGGEFTLLPAGDYNFTVTKFERGRYAGGDKVPACNLAKLEITVHSPEHGDVVVFHNILLHTKTEGLISNFFSGIGQKKKGEPLRMNWGTVVGAKGRLKLGTRSYKDKDGVQRTNNDIKSFHPADEAGSAGQQQQPPFPGQQTQQAWGQMTGGQPFPGAPQGGQQGGGWAPGQF